MKDLGISLAKGMVGTGSGLLAAVAARHTNPAGPDLGYFLAVVVSCLTAISVTLDIARKVRAWRRERQSNGLHPRQSRLDPPLEQTDDCH